MDSPSLDLGPNSPFVGVVLAGGASRRMGRDKALLRVPSDRTSSDRTSRDRTSRDRTSRDRTSSDRTSRDRTSSDRTSPSDRTWLTRTVERLAQAGASSVWVAGGNPSWVPESAQHVPDGRPGQGPLAGIESAMQGSRAKGGRTWCLVLACDLPRLEGESLTRLLQARSAETSAVVALGPSGLEPLVALYQVSLLEELTAFLESGGRSARRFLKGLGSGLKEVELPASVLLNANTPQDLEGL